MFITKRSMHQYMAYLSLLGFTKYPNLYNTVYNRRDQCKIFSQERNFICFRYIIISVIVDYTTPLTSTKKYCLLKSTAYKEIKRVMQKYVKKTRTTRTPKRNGRIFTSA